MKSKYAGNCKDGCGATWAIGADISKNEATGHWCVNPNCPTPDGQIPVESKPAYTPKPKITPEEALDECAAFEAKFGDANTDPAKFESLAKIYISRMMSNR